MRKSLLAAIAALAIAGSANAAPIVYEGTLISGVPGAGTNTQPAGSQAEPDGADYWNFFANAGDAVDLFGDRQAGHYDMSFWVFEGLFADTDDFGPTFDGGDTGFIAFADDEDPPNIPGPFGDPHANFVAPSTGSYTVAVTSFLTDDDPCCGPNNPYTLQVNLVNVPEPLTLSLLGLGLAAVAVRRRRR